MEEEIETALKLTEHCRDFRELRAAFDPIFTGIGTPYCLSYANGIITHFALPSAEHSTMT